MGKITDEREICATDEPNGTMVTFVPDADIFRDYGDEKFAMRIAQNIVKEREIERISTTNQLADLIAESVPAAARRDGHPARRVFQALRIAVNQEFEAENGDFPDFLN